MAIVDEVKDIIKDKKKIETLKEHIEFYEGMVQQGVAKKQEYNIPLVDTVGIRSVENNTAYFNSVK